MFKGDHFTVNDGIFMTVGKTCQATNLYYSSAGCEVVA